MSFLDTLRSLVSVSRSHRTLRISPAMSDRPSLEVSRGRLRQLGATLKLTDDEAVLAVHLPGVTVFAGTGGVRWLSRRVAEKNGWSPHCGVHWGAEAYFNEDLDEHTLTYAWCHNAYDSSYTSRNPWRHGYHALEDIVFGKLTITKKTLWKGPVGVPMPEGVYAGRGKLQRIRHWRPRWPGPWGVFYLEQVEVPQGVEHPGGGPLYSVSPAARSYRGENGAYEAVGAFVASVLKDRGVAAWAPKPRARRVLPLARSKRGGYAWEEYQPLTGTWTKSKNSLLRHEVLLGGYRIDEPACGSCRAKYGEPCKKTICPNLGLRRENKLAKKASS